MTFGAAVCSGNDDCGSKSEGLDVFSLSGEVGVGETEKLFRDIGDICPWYLFVTTGTFNGDEQPISARPRFKGEFL